MLSTLIGIAFLVAALPASDRQATLPELARQHAPNAVYQTRQRELLPIPFDDIVARADLIAHVRIASLRTYLSEDQKELYTDYALAPERVFFQRRTPTRFEPGALPIVERWGGETVIDGVSVTLVDHDLRPFRVGDKLILLLTYHVSEGKYRLFDDLSGAFAVKGDRVQSLVDHPRYARYNGLTIDQFEHELDRARANRD